MSSRDIDIDWDRVWDALDRLRNKQTTNWRDYITNEIMEADEVADIRAQWVASIKAVTGPTNFTLSNSEMGPLLNAAKLGAETFETGMDIRTTWWEVYANSVRIGKILAGTDATGALMLFMERFGYDNQAHIEKKHGGPVVLVSEDAHVTFGPAYDPEAEEGTPNGDGGWDSLMDDIANARDEDKEVALRGLADDILDALKRWGLA